MLLLLALLACRDDPAAWEGANPGECDDGADNEGDGLYDCRDPDCAGAPACLDDSGAVDAAAAAWDGLLNRALLELDSSNVPGVALAVVLDGELAYAAGLGVTQYGGGMPVTTQTSFRWNSVSKMHTAAAVMRLVEEGTLDLDAPVTDWMPDLSVSGGYDASAITLRHAMSHTAAFPDRYPLDCSTTLNAYFASNSPRLWAEPGSFYNYSNINWSLAGRVLELATGQSFREAVAELVLEPSGMASATFDPAEAMDQGPYAIGVDGSYDFYTPENWVCRYIEPAGGLYADVEDMARTLELHLADGGALLSPASVQEMREQVPTRYPSGSFSGLGQFSGSYKGVTYVTHSGAGGGYRSVWGVVPEAGLGVAVVMNASWGEPSELMFDAFDRFLSLPLDYEDARADTDPATWTDYVGVYEDPVYQGTMEVTLDSRGQMFVRFDDWGGEERRLYQYGGDAFFYVWDGAYYVERFMRDDQGRVRWMVNRYWVAHKGDAAASPPSASEEERAEMLEQAGVEALSERGWEEGL